MSRTDDHITSAHGAGGRATTRLIDEVFRPRLASPHLDAATDGVWLGDRAVSTDAFVVTPWVFPGGSLGSLAVHGSVNDLAVVGARARHLTATFVLEEGIAIDALAEQVDAMGEAARRCGTDVVAADTKVVERDHGDGPFVSVTAFGDPMSAWRPDHSAIRAGDAIVVSGPVADHGVAVMIARGDLALSVDVRSDSAPIVDEVAALLSAVPSVRVLRDPTRGGLATVVNELVIGLGGRRRLDVLVGDPLPRIC